jgi:putative ABC transport system permease protein
MPLLPRFNNFLRNLLDRPHVERELDDEVRSLFDLLVEEKQRQGLELPEARRQARLEFGSATRIKDDVRDVRIGAAVETLLQQTRFAFRALRKNPGFTVVTVLTLALGIGANTIMYSVVDGLILHPFPFPDVDRLVAVGTEYPKLGTDLTFVEHISPPEYMDVRDQSRALERVVAWDMGNRQVSFGDVSENLFTGLWWGDAFETIGVPAYRGRGMTLEETLRGDPVAVLSHRVWETRFGADPDLVDNTIIMNGSAYTVVGIMPPRTILYGMDLWIPMGVEPEVIPRQARQWQVMARMRDGFTMAEVNAELEGLSRRTEQEYGAEMEEYQGWHMRALTWTAANARTMRVAAFVLLGAVGFVLLLVCSNVASLVLARSAGRRREMAIRTAMGARRTRLVRQVLTESVVLALFGGGLGLGIAYYGTGSIGEILSRQPFLAGTVELSTRVLLFSFLISVSAGILFGLFPALQSSASQIQNTLKTEGGGTTGSARRLKLQRAFVVVEVALALVLLLGGGLLIGTVINLNSADTGFQPQDVVSMRLTLPSEEFDGPAIGAFFQELEERVGALPGVRSVGRGAQFPPINFAWRRVATEGSEVTREGQLPLAMTTLASPGYFTTLGIPLVRGRTFDDLDVEGSPLVAVINEAAQQSLFAGRDPIGLRIRTGTEEDDPWFEVVGVVGNTINRGFDTAPAPELFANHRQVPGWSNQMFLLVRTDVAPLSVVPAVRETVRAMDSDQPVYRIQTLDDVLVQSTATRRIAAGVLSVLAGFALTLAAVGIFAVVSFAVGERTREIGLRVALGAQAGQVRSMMVRQALAPVILGSLIGLAGATALGTAMSSLLFEMRPTDPVTLVSATALVGLIALVASYVPARRASRLDPIEALNSD